MHSLRLPSLKWNADCHLQKILFKGLRYLHPDIVLSQTARLPYNKLPFAHFRADNADQIEDKYRNIISVNWIDEDVFKGKIPKYTIEFWSAVLMHTTIVNRGKSMVRKRSKHLKSLQKNGRP